MMSKFIRWFFGCDVCQVCGKIIDDGENLCSRCAKGDDE
jgi:hypothetical protein